MFLDHGIILHTKSCNFIKYILIVNKLSKIGQISKKFDNQGLVWLTVESETENESDSDNANLFRNESKWGYS